MAEASRTARNRRWPLLLAAVTLLVAGGVLTHTGWGGSDAAGPAGSTEAGAAPPARLDRAAAVGPSEAGQPSGPAGRPRSIVVPALGVRAAVSPITTEDGALNPPSDPRRIGWWSGGREPGSTRGAAVLTGHTVHTGGGAFDDLEQLAPGDEVVVRTGRSRLAYDVASVRVLSRAELARENTRVFGRSGPARLVLITCEDWDGSAYRSNVVVVARPAA